MSAAAQLAPLVAYTNEDWNEEPWAFWVGSLSNPDSFTGCAFDASIKLRGPGTLTSFSSAAGTLTVTLPNIVSITVPKAVMKTLTPANYDFELRKTVTATGIQTILVRAVVSIVAGLAP